MIVSILRTEPGSGTTNSHRKHLLLFLLLSGFSFLYLNATAEGMTFCVSTPEELQDALTTATDNGEDDVINIVQGVYNDSFILSRKR
jgi:hypothetical protein